MTWAYLQGLFSVRRHYGIAGRRVADPDFKCCMYSWLLKRFRLAQADWTQIDLSDLVYEQLHLRSSIQNAILDGNVDANELTSVRAPPLSCHVICRSPHTIGRIAGGPERVSSYRMKGAPLSEIAPPAEAYTSGRNQY